VERSTSAAPGDDDGSATPPEPPVELPAPPLAEVSPEMLEELLAHGWDSIMVTRSDNRVGYASPSVERLMGFSAGEMMGHPADEFVHPDDYEDLYTEAANQLLLGTEPRPIVFRQRCADGGYIYVEARVNALPPGHPLGVAIINARDVSDRVAAERTQLDAERAHHESQAVIQMVAEGTALDDVVNAVTALVERRAPGCNAVVCSVDEKRQTIRLVGNPNLAASFAARLRERPIAMGMGSCAAAALDGSTTIVTEIEGDPRWDVVADAALAAGLRASWSVPIRSAQDHEIIGTLSLYWPEPLAPSAEHQLVMDEAARLATIALSRARVESELAHRATHDPLTGLPNRSLLYDRIEQALARQRRSKTDDVAAMFVDLDHFKEVNDQLGHSVGDDLLRQAAERLRSTIREVDTIARFGGDEFIVLAHTNDLATLACRLNEAMTAEFPIGEGVRISCSIGVATVTDGDTPDSLIHRADQALYHAKEHGRNCFATYENAPTQGIAMADFDAITMRRRTLR
jgi:diguanylate cyclase (GGDEF)-like protein/PAS domain S-box-containing protein